MRTDPAKMPEHIFITYDGIIKNYRPVLIRKILENHKDAYRQYIDVDTLSSYSDSQLMGLAVQSTDQNIIKYLSIREFNYEKALVDIYNKYDSLFAESQMLTMGHSVSVLLKQSFTAKIYIYTPSYDIRIHADIQQSFGDMNTIEYVTGSFTEAINDLPHPITTYILNDVAFLRDLIAIGKVSYSNVLIGDYGYNYTLDEKNNVVLKLDEVDDKMRQNVFKLVSFRVAKDYEFVQK